MYIISFSHYFVENAEYLSSQTNYPIVYQLQPDQTYHVFSAHDAATQLLCFQKEHPQTKYVIYQSENTESAFFKDKSYIKLLKDNTVYQYSPMIAKYCLNKHKIECASYFAFDYPLIKSTTVRDINVLFFGTMTKKRYDILGVLQQKFDITIVTNAFGKDLEETLLRAKYVLNISAYDNNALETHRINKALACGCKVISNPSYDKDMDKKYRDLIMWTKGRSLHDYMKALKAVQDT
jgi:hypothetical protein